jgi:RHS repeat-associated protein
VAYQACISTRALRLSRTWFRPYHPSLGRWLSRDPIGSINPYSYCYGDPINLIDPLGALVYMMNQHGAVQLVGSTAGHNAVIVGNEKAGYNFMSYGPKKPNSAYGPGAVENTHFNNLVDALKYANSKGYQRYQKYDRPGHKPCNDSFAIKTGLSWDNTDYGFEGGHNSNDFVGAVMSADGVPRNFKQWYPNETFDNLGTLLGKPGGPVEMGSTADLIEQNSPTPKP